MRRPVAVAGSALFFAIAPGTIAGLIPWWITRWRVEPAWLGMEWTRFVGAALVLAGLFVLIECFARFALIGRGTPAPPAPTETLVVSGLYRHVRNPMYVAVLAIIVGQAAIFADARLLIWAALFWLATHLFVTFYEEPELTRTHGAAYEAFRANVPRWLPRLSPWRGEAG